MSKKSNEKAHKGGSENDAVEGYKSRIHELGDHVQFTSIEKQRSPTMANKASSSSSLLSAPIPENEEFNEELFFGSESGWVEARTTCDHLASLSSDLTHIPTPDTPCNRCHHPKENWLCLSCKDVLCSRFVNKHMLDHYQQINHCLALSYSDLSVWCFTCDAYLDAQVILALRPVYETAYILKFGEAPPFRAIECLQTEDKKAEVSTTGN